MQKQFQLHLNADVDVKREEREHHAHKRNASGNFIPVKSEREMLDVMLLEREDAEVSIGNIVLLPLLITYQPFITKYHFFTCRVQKVSTQHRRKPTI